MRLREPLGLGHFHPLVRAALRLHVAVTVRVPKSYAMVALMWTRGRIMIVMIIKAMVMGLLQEVVTVLVVVVVLMTVVMMVVMSCCSGMRSGG